MLVSEFSNTCQHYKDFEVWEIKNMEDFFKGNEILSSIFLDQYFISVDEFLTRKMDIGVSDIDIITNLLQLVGDKSFFIFTLHDENHFELIQMQNMGVMNFGLDISVIKPDSVYAMIMSRMESV